MVIVKSYKFYRVVITDNDGFKKQLILDEDSYHYLCSLSSSKKFHFIAFDNQFDAIVERSKDDKLDDIFNIDSYL